MNGRRQRNSAVMKRNTPPKKPQGAGNALRAPGEGDKRALEDLEGSRALLLARLRSRKTSARDLASLSAELRKVNASIAIVQGGAKNGGVAEEEISARAEWVRARAEKMIAEKAKAPPVAHPKAGAETGT